MSEDQTARERFLSTWGPHCGAPLDVFTGHLDKLLAAERAWCARAIDTPCGVDADPKGMTCARRTPGGKVYHDPGCRRDADDIREGPGEPAGGGAGDGDSIECAV